MENEFNKPYMLDESNIDLFKVITFSQMVGYFFNEEEGMWAKVIVFLL
jgi:hypothetical protein